MQNFRCSHWCSWRCKPFSLWCDVYYMMGLFDSRLCTRCGAEEETAHVPCECKALTSLRPTYLGSFFLDPEDVMSLILVPIKNFSKGTGLPWLWHQIVGHKGSVQTGLHALKLKGLGPIYYSTLFYLGCDIVSFSRRLGYLLILNRAVEEET
jgi:hypothetical protein